MKHSPGDGKLYDNLRPSKFSGEGFLGIDERDVEEIISADSRILENKGITPGEITSALKEAFEAAEIAMGAEIEIRPGVRASYFDSRGRIPSPFRGDGTFSKGEVVLKDDSGREAVITRLSINLIEKHGFFQGRGSRYRTEPEILAEMLGLKGQSLIQ